MNQSNVSIEAFNIKKSMTKQSSNALLQGNSSSMASPNRQSFKNYLEIDMQESYQHRKLNLPQMRNIIKQSIPYNRFKMQRKYRQKKLIIEEQGCETRHNSETFILTKHEFFKKESSLQTVSSQKKTRISQGWQVCSPPKKFNGSPTKKARSIDQKIKKEEDKSKLIKSILTKFKEHIKTNEDESADSPCISSLKLKERSIDMPLSHKDQQISKFLGKTGCPPSKIASKYNQKRQNRESKKHSIALNNQAVLNEDISPWMTEDGCK